MRGTATRGGPGPSRCAACDTQAKARLEEEYIINTHPAASKLVALAKELNETKTRLATWFSNRRTKERKLRLRAAEAAAKRKAAASAVTFDADDSVAETAGAAATRPSLAFTLGHPQEQHPDADMMGMIRSPICLDSGP